MDRGKSRLPIYLFTCKKCGREFLTHVAIIWEKKGTVTCANCGESSCYQRSELKSVLRRVGTLIAA